MSNETSSTPGFEEQEHTPVEELSSAEAPTSGRRTSVSPENQPKRSSKKFNFEILTAARRLFNFKAALPRDRFAAFALDGLIAGYASWILFWLTDPFFANLAFLQRWQGISSLFYPALPVFFFILLYFVLFETFLGGTPGKLLCRLRVINYEGEKPSFSASLLRHFFRLIDLPLLPLVTLFWMERSVLYQRPGDKIAQTTVIKRTRKVLTPMDLKEVSSSPTVIRFLSFLADLVCIGLLCYFYGLNLNPANPARFFFFLSLLPLWIILYFFIFEFIFSTTPGKMIFKRGVVLENGEPLDATTATLRTLARPIDSVLGYLIIPLTRRKQRLGDVLSDTLVVRQKIKKGYVGALSLVFILGILAFTGLKNPARGWLQQELALLKVKITSPTLLLQQLGILAKPAWSDFPPLVTTSKNLQLVDVQFFAGNSQEPRPQRNFKPGEAITLQFQLRGLQKKGGDLVHVAEHLRLVGPHEEVISQKLYLINSAQVLPGGAQEVSLSNRFLLPSKPLRGKYKIILVLQDEVAKEQLASGMEFHVD